MGAYVPFAIYLAIIAVIVIVCRAACNWLDYRLEKALSELDHSRSTDQDGE